MRYVFIRASILLTSEIRTRLLHPPKEYYNNIQLPFMKNEKLNYYAPVQFLVVFRTMKNIPLVFINS